MLFNLIYYKKKLHKLILINTFFFNDTGNNDFKI